MEGTGRSTDVVEADTALLWDHMNMEADEMDPVVDKASCRPAADR